MRRPQGFDRPPPDPGADRGGESVEPSRSGRRPRAASEAGGDRRSAGAAASVGAAEIATTSRRGLGVEDRVATEPIPIVVTARVPSVPVEVPPPDGPEPPSSSSSAEKVDRPQPGGSRSALRAARRAARRTAAERRRYERSEVRRFTLRSRRRRLAWIVGLGSVGLLVVLVAVVAYSPITALREIRVEGASRVSADELVTALGDEIGTPLALLDPERIHRAVAGFSLVEQYSTETIPPGTLVVRIVERQPIGAIEGNGGWDLVDAAGVVISHSDGPPDGQPRIEARGGIVGDAFASAAAVIRSLPAEVRGQLATVTASTPDDVRLGLTSGADVVWGSAEQSSLKASVLAALMRAAPPDTVGRYDVSAPTSPVTS